MIALVLTLPFYSANVLAVSVQITKNSGEDGIDKFIDAESDVWTVEALITDALAETVQPEDVQVKIGENYAPFKSCSASSFGQSCQYISPLTDGVQESEHAFQVVYNYVNELNEETSASSGDVIKADGSAPVITGLKAYQRKEDPNKGKISLDFTVNDKKPELPSVGLKQIDVLDADNGNVLQTIVLNGEESYNYLADGDFDGVLKNDLSGEGKKRIKVRAEDRLGHKALSSYVQFDADFVKPEIKGELNLTRFGQFIGEYAGKTDIIVYVIENTVPGVRAYSEQANLKGEPAVCAPDEATEDLWGCKWTNIDVTPQSTVTVLVKAEDQFGNAAEKSLSKTLTVDNSPPKIKFFGTQRQFEGKSYLKSGENRIILQAEDEGAGISKDGIRANLGALGGSKFAEPDECAEKEGVYECYWDIDEKIGDGVLKFGLSVFEDKVGNEGEMPEYEFFVDNVGPKVEEIEVYGTSDGLDKDYFQSNDIVKLKFTAFESSGLNILINVNDLVMDAETKYAEDFFTEDISGGGDGWQRLTGESCEKVEGKWGCVVETEAIKSGPDSSVRLEVKIQDTAGNDASLWPEESKEPRNVQGVEGKYTLNLLGLAVEDNPDYWEMKKGYPKAMLPIVDLDTTTISYARMPVEVRLDTDSPAEVLSLELVSCLPASEAEMSGEAETQAAGEEKTAGSGEKTAKKTSAKEEVSEKESGPSPALSRSLVYGTHFPEGETAPVTTLILEFEPFDGRQFFSLGSGTFEQVEAAYVCQMKIYSKVGKKAIKAAEIQDILVKVPFGFTSLGSLDESLKQKVTDLKGSGWMTFFDVIHVIDQVLQWINYILRILSIILTVNEIVGIFTGVVKTEAQIAQEYPAGIPLSKALEGACLGTVTATQTSWEFVEWIQIPVEILNCNPGVFYRGADSQTGKTTREMTAAELANAKQGKIDVSESGFGLYAQWQQWVLDAYNIGSGRWLMGLEATSLYDNLYASILGLCVPGIIHNIEKAREIHCRRIVCYGAEVPAGIATMDSCEKLFDLQMCEFVWGPFFDWTPIGGIAYIGQMIKGAFTSPLGLISLAEYLICFPLCFAPDSGALLNACRVASVINKVISILNQIIGAVQIRPDVTSSQYCDMADEVSVEQLTGQVKPG
ncbi:MAG: hypothetical protein AB1668_01125 [Nanoarchaeota archaeon]